jgi:hypothetical protein
MDCHRRHEKLNYRRGDSVNRAVEKEVIKRLEALDCYTVKLPLDSNYDSTIKHVPILHSSNLKSAKKILVVIPEDTGSGLGIHSFRHCTDKHVGNGSMETLFKRARAAGYTGLVAMNPSAWYWDALKKTAVTHYTWTAYELDKKRAPTGAILDIEDYKIPGHESPENHIATCLSYLLTQLNPTAMVDFVATSYSAYGLFLGLEKYWSEWEKHANAAILAETGHSIIHHKNEAFKEWFRKRCRNYESSLEKVGTYLGPNFTAGVASFSAGEVKHNSEIITTAVIGQIIPYFNWAREVDIINDRKAKDRVARKLRHDAKAVKKALKKAEAEAGKSEEPNTGVEEDSDDDSSENEDEDEDEQLNPLIPVEIEDFISGESAQKDWLKAFHELDLSAETPGWDVPGMDKVDELAKKKDEENEIIAEIKRKAMEEGKKIRIFREDD